MSVYPILYPYNASTEKLTWEIVGDSVTVVPNSIAPDYREITAATPGITTIRAKVDNVYSDLLIIEVKENFCTITDGPIDDCSAVNKTFTLNGYSEPSFADLSWESSNKAVATIDPETGTVTTHSFGSTIITLTATVGDFSCTYTITLDVTDVSAVLIEDVPDGYVLTKGSSYQFTTYVLPENQNNPSLEWSSSDNSIATVSSTGLVTGVDLGVVTITVRSKYNPEIYDVCTLSIITSFSHILFLNSGEENWTEQAAEMRTILANRCYKNSDGTVNLDRVILHSLETAQDFTTYWNKLDIVNNIPGNKIDNVIVFIHGNPTGMGSFVDETEIDISDIDALESKNVRNLILMVCSAGDVNTDYNLAKAFAKKTKGGPVLSCPSDQCYDMDLEPPIFWSAYNDDPDGATPYDLVEDDNHLGWLVYQQINNVVTWQKTGKRTLNINQMISILEEY